MSGRISILTYHQVGDFPRSHRRHLYCHYRRFEQQLEYLHRSDYSVLSMDDVVACLRGERTIPARAVALTFDDGYESFYKYAFPALTRYRFPAMVYLVSGLIGQSAQWYSGGDQTEPELLGRESILELRQGGIHFGAHGVNHVRLSEVSAARVREELVQSKTDLEELLGEEVRHFCYPYGSYTPAVIEATRTAGYASAVTCVRGRVRQTDNLLALPRKAISYNNGLLDYYWKLRF